MHDRQWRTISTRGGATICHVARVLGREVRVYPTTDGATVWLYESEGSEEIGRAATVDEAKAGAFGMVVEADR